MNKNIKYIVSVASLGLLLASGISFSQYSNNVTYVAPIVYADTGEEEDVEYIDEVVEVVEVVEEVVQEPAPVSVEAVPASSEEIPPVQSSETVSSEPETTGSTPNPESDMVTVVKVSKTVDGQELSRKTVSVKRGEIVLPEVITHYKFKQYRIDGQDGVFSDSIGEYIANDSVTLIYEYDIAIDNNTLANQSQSDTTNVDSQVVKMQTIIDSSTPISMWLMSSLSVGLLLLSFIYYRLKKKYDV